MRRRDWLASELRRKRLQAQAAVMKYINSDSVPVDMKTHKGALRSLMATTGLPKNVLREEIARVFDMLLNKSYPNVIHLK